MRKLIIAAAAALAMFGIGVAPASASTAKAQFTPSCSGGLFNMVPHDNVDTAINAPPGKGATYAWAATGYAPYVDNLCWLNDGVSGYAEIVDYTDSVTFGFNACLTWRSDATAVSVQGCYGAAAQQWDAYLQSSCGTHGCWWNFGNEYTDNTYGTDTYSLEDFGVGVGIAMVSVPMYSAIQWQTYV